MWKQIHIKSKYLYIFFILIFFFLYMEAHNKIISYAMDITEENEFINETDLDSTVEIQEIQKLPTIMKGYLYPPFEMGAEAKP